MNTPQAKIEAPSLSEVCQWYTNEAQARASDKAEHDKLRASLEGLAAWMDASPSHVGSKLIRRVLAGEIPPAPGAEWEVKA